MTYDARAPRSRYFHILTRLKSIWARAAARRPRWADAAMNTGDRAWAAFATPIYGCSSTIANLSRWPISGRELMPLRQPKCHAHRVQHPAELPRDAPAAWRGKYTAAARAAACRAYFSTP